MMNEEIRRYTNTDIETAESEDMIFEGYALKFDTVTKIRENGKIYLEKINRDALDGVNFDDTVLTLNHDKSSILAGVRNGSLKLTVDNIGLRIWAKITDTTIGRDAYKLVKDKLINGMSFIARTQSKWHMPRDKMSDGLREITRFSKLFDVSVVTFPAYKDTSVVARSEEGVDWDKEVYKNQIKQLNELLGGMKK